MEPVRYADRAVGQIVGVERRVELKSADWGDLWNNGYMPRMADVDAAGEGHPCCGYYFPTDEEGVVDFIMGKSARDDAAPADGLVVREVPAAHYAVFECAMAEIGQTWGAIYGEWLPTSGWLGDESAPCFESFGPGCHEGAEPVLIYVPVRKP